MSEGLLAVQRRKIIEEFDNLWKNRGFNTAIQLAIEDTEKRVLAVLGEAEKHLRELWKEQPSLLTIDYLKEDETRTTEQILEQFINDVSEWFSKVEKRVFGDKQQ